MTDEQTFAGEGFTLFPFTGEGLKRSNHSPITPE